MEIQKQQKWNLRNIKADISDRIFRVITSSRKIILKKILKYVQSPEKETRRNTQEHWDEGKFFAMFNKKLFLNLTENRYHAHIHSQHFNFSSFFVFSSLLFVVLAIGAEVSDLMILMVGKEGIFLEIFIGYRFFFV